MRKLQLFLIILFVLVFVGTILAFYFSFSTKYKDIIKENIVDMNEEITLNLVLSIIKQESKFDKNAKSNKDAFGLMQLTFLTAKEQAEKLDMEISINDLYVPEINIKLGVNYLNYLFGIFGDKQLVLLSYNAGLGNVNKWLENNEIYKKNGVYVTPFKESNNYLRCVLQNEKIYNIINR